LPVSQQVFRPDVVAGGAAVVVVVLILVAGGNPVLAIVAAIAAYAAVAWRRARSARQERDSPEEAAERSALAYEASLPKVAVLRQLAPEIEREGTRELVVRICDTSDQVLGIMSAGAARSAAPLYLEQLLEPAEALVETYAHLASRGLRATDEAQARIESQDLPKIERASRLVLERLRQEPDADLDALRQILAFDLETAPSVVEPRRRR
jgi:hypothetical protein